MESEELEFVTAVKTECTYRRAVDERNFGNRGASSRVPHLRLLYPRPLPPSSLPPSYHTMVPFSPDNPFANAPPDKASVTLPPQQIDKQHFFLDGHNPEDFEFDSDVDSRLSGCHVDDSTLEALLDHWKHSPQCGGMPTFHPVGSADFEVYPPSLFSGSSDSDHSTLSPPCSDPWSAGADKYKDKDLFGPNEGTHAAAGPGVAFGTQAIFPHAPSVPYPSPRVQLGYGPPLWRHMDGAATTDVRCPPPSYDYPIVGPFPPTGTAHLTNKTCREEDVSPTNASTLWSYGGSMDNSGGVLFSAGARTIDPSVLSTIPTPRYSPGSVDGQEQPQGHHHGVALADALGLGSNMQIAVYPDEAEIAPSLSDPYPSPDAPGPEKPINEACKDVPFKKPATSTSGKKKRKQSTEKVYACPWPQCLRCKSTITTPA